MYDNKLSKKVLQIIINSIFLNPYNSMHLQVLIKKYLQLLRSLRQIDFRALALSQLHVVAFKLYREFNELQLFDKQAVFAITKTIPTYTYITILTQQVMLVLTDLHEFKAKINKSNDARPVLALFAYYQTTLDQPIDIASQISLLLKQPPGLFIATVGKVLIELIKHRFEGDFSEYLRECLARKPNSLPLFEIGIKFKDKEKKSDSMLHNKKHKKSIKRKVQELQLISLQTKGHHLQFHPICNDEKCKIKPRKLKTQEIVFPDKISPSILPPAVQQVVQQVVQQPRQKKSLSTISTRQKEQSCVTLRNEGDSKERMKERVMKLLQNRNKEIKRTIVVNETRLFDQS